MWSKAIWVREVHTYREILPVTWQWAVINNLSESEQKKLKAITTDSS